MIELSEEYKKNIVSMFGDVGSNWLSRIPGIIDKYVNEFGLTDIRLNHGLTYNVVAFANSSKYGEVVLKIEIPFEEMTIRESLALELNNGEGACKCLYKNISDGVLLLERLMPGYSLTTLDSLDERTRIFAYVSKRFNVKVNRECGLPLYSDILARSVNIASTDSRFSDISDLILNADEIYKEIESKNDNDYLLHSDLYSDNIIMSNDVFKAIDPHGFVGNKIIDTAIFAQKELDKLGYSKQNINYMLDLLSTYCDYDKIDLANILYVNYVLNICWDKEVNIKNDESIENARLIFDYVDNYSRNDNALIRKKKLN